MKVKFNIPVDLTKELSKNTKVLYTAKLNRLAVEGYASREDLLNHQEAVCNKLFELAGGEDGESNRQTRRIYLCAIFWILHSIPLEEKRNYYEAFQTSKHSYVAPAAADSAE